MTLPAALAAYPRVPCARPHARALGERPDTEHPGPLAKKRNGPVVSGFRRGVLSRNQRIFQPISEDSDSRTMNISHLFSRLAVAAAPHHGGGEANLVLPDLGSETFLGVTGHTLLLVGLVVCALGLVFGLVAARQLKKLPVHKSMREISELIYETCKTYLDHAGQVHRDPLGLHRGDHRRLLRRPHHRPRGAAGDGHGPGGGHPRLLARRHRRQLGVAWFGIRVNTFANSRTAFASLARQAVPDLRDPAQGRHEHRHDAHLASSCCIMLVILLFIPRRLRRPVLHRLRDRRVARRRRRSASPAASSRRSPTSARTS